MQARLVDEVEVLRWCLDWLERLERGEMVVVNLRPDTEDVTEYVQFDHARVRRVLARIAADLDTLAHQGPATETEHAEPAAEARVRRAWGYHAYQSSRHCQPKRGMATW
jgi:hypothetical protein